MSDGTATGTNVEDLLTDKIASDLESYVTSETPVLIHNFLEVEKPWNINEMDNYGFLGDVPFAYFTGMNQTIFVQGLPDENTTKYQEFIAFEAELLEMIQDTKEVDVNSTIAKLKSALDVRNMHREGDNFMEFMRQRLVFYQHILLEGTFPENSERDRFLAMVYAEFLDNLKIKS